MTPDSVLLLTDSVFQLSAVAHTSGGQQVSSTFTWRSADTDIATVSPTGLVRAKRADRVMIFARSGGIEGSAHFFVRDGALVGPSGGSVNGAGGRVALSVPQGALSAASVLTVIPAGDGLPPSTRQVTGAAYEFGPSGTTFAMPIIASIAYAPASIPTTTSESRLRLFLLDGGAWRQVAGATVDSTAHRIVAPLTHFSTYAVMGVVPVDRIVIASGTPSSLMPGQTLSLQAKTLDSTGDELIERSVLWASASPEVASVDASGVVSAHAPGSATITASSEGRQASLAVTVVPVPVRQLLITPASATLHVGESTTLAAQPRDSTGSPLAGRTVTWRSADTTIVGVTSTGAVTARAVGGTTIFATSEGVTVGALVTVIAAPPTPVAQVAIVPSTASVVAGQSVQLSAEPRDSAGHVLDGRAISWHSADTTIATVSETGLVSGHRAGSTTIVATSGGVDGSAALQVTAAPPSPVARVVVTPDSVTLAAGGTVQLTAETRDANGAILTGRQIVWASSDTLVAGVESTGLVRTRTPGVATITATSEGKSGTAALTVTASTAHVARVTIAPAGGTILVAANLQLTATAYDSSGGVVAGRAMTWRSSNVNRLTVSPTGLAHGVSPGQADVTVVCDGVTVTSTFTVTLAPVASVTITPASLGLTVGRSAPLTATLRDVNGNDIGRREIHWSSTAPAVARLDSASLTATVLAQAPGLDTIVATSEGVSGRAVVTVAAGVTRVWQGGLTSQASTWSIAGNWSPSGVPGALDTVRIPAAAVQQPVLYDVKPSSGVFDTASIAALSIEHGASLSLASFLSVSGAIDAGSGITALYNQGYVISTAQSVRIQGSFPNLELRGQDTVVGPLTTSANLDVTQTGRLVIGGRTVTVGGDFDVIGQGTFVMADAHDSLVVHGSAVLRGGDGSGLESAGVMLVGGYFVTMGSRTLRASGTHKVVLNGNGTGQRLAIDSSALYPVPPSHHTVFQNLEIAGSARITYPTSIDQYCEQQQYQVGWQCYFGLLIQGEFTMTGSSSLEGYFVDLRGAVRTEQGTAIGGPGGGGAQLRFGAGTTLSEIHGRFAPTTTVLATRQATPLPPQVSLGNTYVVDGTQAIAQGAVSTTFLSILGNGSDLTLAGHTIRSSGGIVTDSSGTITMTNSADTLVSEGTAIFRGGDETARMTRGVLVIGGHPGLSGGLYAVDSLPAFRPTGDFKVLLHAQGDRNGRTGVGLGNAYSFRRSPIPRMEIDGEGYVDLGWTAIDGDLTISGPVHMLSDVALDDTTATTIKGNLMMAAGSDWVEGAVRLEGSDGLQHVQGGPFGVLLLAHPGAVTVPDGLLAQDLRVVNGAQATLAGRVTVGFGGRYPFNRSGSGYVRGAGSVLRLAGHTLAIADTLPERSGYLTVAQGGIVDMTDSRDSLLVNGGANFTGAGDETGHLTAGVMTLTGDLYAGDNSHFDASRSFVATGSHKLRLSGTGSSPQYLAMGCCTPSDSSFTFRPLNDVEVAGSAGVVSSMARMNGSLLVSSHLTLPGTYSLWDVLGNLTLGAGSTLAIEGQLRYGGSYVNQGATISGNAPVHR